MEEEKNKTKQKRETVLRQRQALDPEAESGMLKEETRVDTARGEGVLVIKHAKSCVTCSDKTWADITTRWTRSSCTSLQPPDRPLSLRRQRYHLEA